MRLQHARRHGGGPHHRGAVPVQEGRRLRGLGSRKKFWTNDDYPLFPTSEREWDATGQTGSDCKDFTSVTKDKVVMDIPVTVRFTLKTDCPTLKKFYTSYARRYGAHFDSDGTYNDQWETLLRKLVADPSDQTLDRIVQQYNWQNVWNDPKTKTDIEQQLNAALAVGQQPAGADRQGLVLRRHLGAGRHSAAAEPGPRRRGGL